MAGRWDCLVIGRQLTVVHPGPPYQALGGQPAALPLLEVAGGEGGLGGRARGAGGEGGAGKVGKGGTLRPGFEDKVVEGHVAVRLDAALHLNIHLTTNRYQPCK